MNRLNNICFVFLIFVLSTISFGQRTSEWEKLTSPTNDVLRKIFFLDQNNGWAIGLSGAIVHTSDGGNTWVLQNSTVTTPLVDLFFLNENLGWALTHPQTPPFGTTVLKTTSGGSTWFKDSTFFLNEIMYTIYFFNEHVGVVGGNGVKKTSDGGISWQKSFIEPGGVSTLPINNFAFYSNTFGYACGGRIDVAGVIWRTTDGGDNWSYLGLSPDQIFDVFIFDSLNALALSGDPEGFYQISKLKTTNGGLSWNSTALPLLGLSFTIDFQDDKEGWSASGYKFLHTGNSGDTWVEELTPDSTTIYDLQFVDKYTGFACGEDGALLKFISFKKPGVNKPVFELLQNHPNPFSEKTTFQVSAITPDYDVPARAQIKLFDVLGNEILTMVDRDFNWGIYEFTFDFEQAKRSLSSGVYILVLVSGETLVTRKIIYLK
ncbi:MAG: T9SS type A sorting domain-containing protein [Ignavibacteriales bacterium]|nr:T9SS type A sorting domain-containing protein [Ignavibacteriales bacterium]